MQPIVSRVKTAVFPSWAARAYIHITQPQTPGLNSRAPSGFMLVHTMATGSVGNPAAFVIALCIGISIMLLLDKRDWFDRG
jgi:hypothetical protein